MINIENSVKVWITSDTHYSHKNICRGVTSWRMPDGTIPIEQTRPFSTIREMNEKLIKNINDYVGQDDVLIHLGDWSFGGFENIRDFWDRLICKNIHLILGNHDHHIERNRDGVKGLFQSVSFYNEMSYMGETLVLMHYPITSWNGLRKGRIHIHGHCHLPPNKKISGGRRIDCGVDGHPEFRPYDLYEELIKPMKKVAIGSELGHNDHHTDLMKNVVG